MQSCCALKCRASCICLHSTPCAGGDGINHARAVVLACSCEHTAPLQTSRCIRLQVDLYENGTIAIVEAVSPELGNRIQRVRVQLPGTSSELLGKFRDKKVDFAAHSNTEDGGAVFLNLLGDYLISSHLMVWLSFGFPSGIRVS